MQQESAYKKAGVDIDSGNLFVNMIKSRIREAWPESVGEIGGFAGGGPIPEGAKKIKACTDGTGTKAIIAAVMDMMDGIGQDAAAMSVVDAYVAGVRPLYLLDSLQVAVLDPYKHIKIIDSIIRACESSGCLLVGGETAELPDLFKYEWMFNVDTFVVGFEAPELSFAPVEPWQLIYGWPSCGPGSNGYSLIRNVFGLKTPPSKMRRKLERKYKALDSTLAEALLIPTPIWIPDVEKQRARGVIFAGHAHITGGGMVENIPRILPKNCKAVIKRHKWERPPIFKLIQKLGKVKQVEMDRVFNQGIMMISIVDPEGPLINHPSAIKIGEVRRRNISESQVEFIGKYRDKF